MAVARVGERLYGFEDRCTHDDGDLAGGRLLEGSQVECPRHGARFYLTSGRAARMPAVVGIKTYAVGIDEGWVWIEIPEVVHEQA